MSKELDAFKKIKTEWDSEGDLLQDWMDNNDIEIVENGLKRLEAIDNAEPSQALSNLECLKSHISARDMLGETNKKIALDICNDIEKALLKAQANARSEEILQKHYEEGITLDSVRALKQEKDNYKKVLEIIKEKNVDIQGIIISKDVASYNREYSKYFRAVNCKKNCADKSCNWGTILIPEGNDYRMKWIGCKATLLTEEEFDLIKRWSE